MNKCDFYEFINTTQPLNYVLRSMIFYSLHSDMHKMYQTAVACLILFFLELWNLPLLDETPSEDIICMEIKCLSGHAPSICIERPSSIVLE